jgi:hypothetical protein
MRLRDDWHTQHLARQRQMAAEHEQIENTFWRLQLPVAEMAGPTLYAFSQFAHPEMSAVKGLNQFNRQRQILMTRSQQALSALRSPYSRQNSASQQSRQFSQLQQVQLNACQATPAAQIKPLLQQQPAALRQAGARYQQAQATLALHKQGLKALMAETPWIQSLMHVTPLQGQRLTNQPQQFLQRFYQRALLQGQDYNPAFFRRVLGDVAQAGHLRSLLVAGSGVLGLLGFFETQRELRHAQVGRPT